jgi:hypothetical protein
VVPESELPRRAYEIIADDALAARFAAAARDRATTLFPASAMVTAHVAACARFA